MMPLLEGRSLTKRFFGVPAVNEVDFEIVGGMVHALLGENGAGKTTLIRMLVGDLDPDQGELLVRGEPAVFHSPSDAIDAGIAYVSQERQLVPTLSVAENISMAALPGQRGLVDWGDVKKRARTALSRLGADIDVDRSAGYLSAADQQLVEIARALTLDARVLLLDEPTASLSTQEVQGLFDVLRTLRDDGVGIVLISHRIPELYEMCDRVTVMRDGRRVLDAKLDEVAEHELITAMVGMELEAVYATSDDRSQERILTELVGLETESLHDVSIELRSGEIVGVYGLVGSGAIELPYVLFGQRKANAGTLTLNGEAIPIARTPRTAIKQGFGLVPEERRAEGIVIESSVAANTTMATLSRYSRVGWLLAARETRRVAHWIGQLGIRPPGPRREVGTLSGGNQQKVLFARWLEADSRILLLAEPTRGVDIGARRDIYRILDDLAQKGSGILLASSDLEEVVGVCDRVYVFSRGHIVAHIEGLEISQASVLAAAAGGDGTRHGGRGEVS